MRFSDVGIDTEALGQRLVAEPQGHGHAVQFYEDSSYLYGVVAGFLAGGFASGQPAIVIATPEHRSGFLTALTDRGFDCDALIDSAQLVLLDALETLDAFMVDGMPSRRAFLKQMDALFQRVQHAWPGREIRAYGEMVDLLWVDGNRDAAIRLEEMWNTFAESHAFSLLCAYSIANFSSATDAAEFAEICRQHQHVIPTERYSAADDGARLVEITSLQQRALALETELETRRRLERQLRETLLEQEMTLQRERIARAEAEEANRAKRDFLAVMSHELRTPLNAIAGYAELIELGVHGPVSERQRESLERIQESQRRLLGLIDEVLMYSRSESGKVRYDIDTFPLQEALRAADLVVLPQMRAKDIDYAVAVCGPDVVVHADRQKVQQILVNLLGNAMKFTSAGGRIRVVCEAGEREVEIHVHDTGIGVPADMCETIFQPFYQVDPRLTRVHEGAGLGLAISREFARGMGGDVTATSVTGKGSTFSLTLPTLPG